MQMPGLKRYLPRTLAGRAGLILVLPVIMLQVVVSIVFIQRHVEDVTEQMAANVLVELHYILDAVASARDLPAARLVARELAPAFEVRMRVPSTGAPRTARNWYDLSGRAVEKALFEGLPQAQGVDLERSKSQVYMTVTTPHGLVELRFPRARVSAVNPHQLLVLMVVTGLLITLIAFLFLRNQLRPITQLSAASEAFGKGRHVAYKPSGATEVRSAGRAFLDMRNRIERQIEQRTLMLSGVSHDLRTPLTRMTLELSLMEDSDEVRALERDVRDMQRLVDEFLSFARGDALEAPADTDLTQLVSDVVCQTQKAGHAVTLEATPDMSVHAHVRPMAVQRALENLVGNAVRYGSRGWVSLTASAHSVRLRVEDDGPGIPEAQRAEALKPFARLDPARNQNMPGVGLGLAIAADVARSHGGQLLLGQSPEHGGLRADITLAL